MPANRQELRERAKSRADMLGQSFVSDLEWNDFLNAGLSELHDIIIKANEDQFVVSSDVVLVPGTDTYPLPTDFYYSRGMDFRQQVGASDARYRLTRYEFNERNDYREAVLHPGLTLVGPYYEYRIEGSNFKLIPEPGSGTVTLWYVPQYVPFPDDTTAIDRSYANNWEEFVAVAAAIKGLQKEESDTSALEGNFGRLIARIQHAASERDLGEPRRVTDVRYGGQFASFRRRGHW